MIFNSFSFAIFFPCVTALYFLTPHRWRWQVLLAASAVFYMAFVPLYILILAVLIAIDYTAGLLIERSEGRARLVMLSTSIAANITVLGFFKYFNFIAGSVAWIAADVGVPLAAPLLRVAVPIGLSFHTFQAMAYTIAVYRRSIAAERHLGIFALYIMFYPQLVAGPIERPDHLLPQMRERHSFDAERIANGLRLMAWGFLKKVVIADRLAPVVNTVYGDPAAYSRSAVALATFFFAWQIYCDFSGYSDIAIGAAEVMGFRLMVNFRRPYLAPSIREFWHRWHVSLSTWFRDFVYIPLGGSRHRALAWAAVVLVTFALSGLWHGANWTFVAWGLLNGVYLIVGRFTERGRAAVRRSIGLSAFPRVERAWRVCATFGLICVSWVWFRAATLKESVTLFKRLTQTGSGLLRPLPMLTSSMVIAFALIGTLLLVEAAEYADDPRPLVVGRPAWVRWSAYYTVLLTIAILGMFNQSPFIYFQF